MHHESSRGMLDTHPRSGGAEAQFTWPSGALPAIGKLTAMTVVLLVASRWVARRSGRADQAEPTTVRAEVAA